MAVMARRRDPLAALVQELHERTIPTATDNTSQEHIVLPADVSIESHVTAAAAEVRAHTRSIDVLVNAAGTWIGLGHNYSSSTISGP